MKRVADKVALITGGASGLGAGIAKRFVAEGARVVITDLQEDKGQALAYELGCQFLQQDVVDEQQWSTIVKQIEIEHGALRILVNNAGVEGPFEGADPENTTLSDWRKIQQVNVEGVSPQEYRDRFEARLPQGEYQTKNDVASPVLFLVSDEARHITGTKLVVDGGGTLGS
ncbi:SDR family NAD(P)-dependent oxidoreductase [Paremcibacter congregatus]|uniref:Uncharacterized protein n=1 Tax=Paremcibacter congregatus TaxID=2043170 RepID=A0A2G4YR56_9PROT|nr:SDR family oxidoreductase [Paremcibacter congregatus]PHZ84777.1 hypothetical protein CRD36_10120 [Paremcibacter congregatus]QDE26230.1 SDR family oxidoreductase [Paremcibacter congregatus]